MAWDIDDDKHWLDLSLPVVKDSDGSPLTIDGASSNVPFRRSDPAPYLGKLVLGNAFKRWPFDGNEIFGSQSKLSEIEPPLLPDDAVSSTVSTYGASFGAIPYCGDLYLRCAPSKAIGNCYIVDYAKAVSDSVTYWSATFWQYYILEMPLRFCYH